MSPELAAVERAARKSQASTHALRLAVAKAVAAGATVTEAATAAGVTRQTVYRWLGR